MTPSYPWYGPIRARLNDLAADSHQQFNIMRSIQMSMALDTPRCNIDRQISDGHFVACIRQWVVAYVLDCLVIEAQ